MKESLMDEFAGLDDAGLMVLAGKGRDDAFERLVVRHQQPVVNFFARMGVSTVAEDLAQETFVRLHRYRGRYRPAAKFTTFLYTVARHVWVDFLRRKKRCEATVAGFAAEAEGSTDGGIGAAAARMDVAKALASLPEAMRSAVVLTALQGLKFGEAAQVLGVPVGTVKSRVFNALARMREALDEGE